MTTAWAIIETNYEYDDSRYSESGSLPPKLVYLSQEKAVKQCQDLTIGWLREIEIDNYSYDMDDAISGEGQKLLLEMAPMLEIHGHLEDEDNIFEPPYDNISFLFSLFVRSCSEEQVVAFLPHVLLKPYHISEVFIED
jgi:hypothetical protein